MSSIDTFPTLPPGEQDFLMDMFTQDAKNYHVWTYRHWLVRHFSLWDDPREFHDVELLLSADLRNNSAWNHRFVLRFGPRDGDDDDGMPRPPAVVDEEVVDSELQYVQRKILLAPDNRSPWAYARGVFRAAARPLAEWKGFASRFITEQVGDRAEDSSGAAVVGVKSSHAVEWLADVYVEELHQERGGSGGGGGVDAAGNDAVRMFSLLKDKYDPIRKNYWDYRIRMLAPPELSA